MRKKATAEDIVKLSTVPPVASWRIPKICLRNLPHLDKRKNTQVTLAGRVLTRFAYTLVGSNL
jgi:hypothetical protein